MSKFLMSLLAFSLWFTLGCEERGSNSPAPMAAVQTATQIDPGSDADPDVLNPLFEKRWNEFYEQPYDTGGTFVVGLIGEPDALNPLVSTTRGATDINSHIFMKLTRTNPDFSHGSELAKSWEFSEDHLELTFYLRDDVFWTDGVKTTAHDVKFSFERMRDPIIAWSAIKWKRFIKECIVVDDYTVKFVFSQLYPYQLMDAAVGYIVPKHILEKIPSEEWKSCDFNRKPIGNGPFKLKEWQAQQHVVIEANENYCEGRPPLDRVVFKVIPDQEALKLELKSEQIDFMEAVPARFFDELSKVPHLVPHVYPSRNYVYIAWNLKNPLFETKKVRRALTMAINRQEIVDVLHYGFAEVCRGPISPIIWAHNPNLPLIPYDPEAAKKLLAEEGWRDSDGDGWLDKDGQRFEFSLKTNKGNEIREDITVIAQSQLKDVGIKVSPNLLEWTVFSQDMRLKNFEAAVAGWSVALKMDMTTIWHSSSINDKFNWVSYSNPEFDRLNDEAVMVMDRAKAKQMWWRAQELIVEDQPYTFIYTPQQINFIHSRFQNVQMETVGWPYNLRQWWVPKNRQRMN